MQDGPEIDIDKLAALARVHLTDAEKAAFSKQVPEIIGFFRTLQELDVDGIAPMAHPFEAVPELREDRPGAAWNPERALLNAPASRDDQVVVPKVVEDA